MRKEGSHFNEVLDYLLFKFGLEFDDFQVLSVDGLYFYGGVREEFLELQIFRKEFSPERLNLSEKSLLDEVQFFHFIWSKVEVRGP